MAVPPPSAKAALRAEALAARALYSSSLAPELRAKLEDQLTSILRPQLAGAATIGLYHPMKAEISPLPLLSSWTATIAFPWFAGRDAAMMFRQAPTTAIGPWGVLQPAGDAPAVAPEIVIVPLVLADRRGTRIGHGKGHYDRALAHLRDAGPVRTVGIGWAPQIVDFVIEPDPWDIPLDALATPDEWIECR